MKIELPHIGYTVHIKDRRVSKRAASTMHAATERMSAHSATIYIPLPLKRQDEPTLVHEIIHVLQYICESKHIDFVQEQEHMAYIANHIFNRALGYHYVVPKAS